MSQLPRIPRDRPTRRVAVVTYHSSPLREPGSGDAGGMTVYVRELAEAMARRGAATDIFTRANAGTDRPVELSPSVRVVPIEAGPLEQLPKDSLPPFIPAFVAGARAFAMSQRIAYDAVHSHYWQSGLAGMELASVWGTPFLHSNHTLGRVKNRTLAPGEHLEPEIRIAGEHKVIAAADALIASSEGEYSDLACLYSAPHDRLKTLTPGVDHALFHPMDAIKARQSLGLEDRPTLLYVGRIQPLKGLELAVRALEQLVHALEIPPVLVVVGGPSGAHGDQELARLRSLATSLGVTDHVIFRGAQPHHRLPAFYAASDVVVVCSYSESFGFAALEAHASGRPVVGTPVGGLSHVVRSGATGFLIAERDPTRFAATLKTLLSDRGLADSFGSAAEQAAARFTWDAAADALLELCDCLIETRAPEACVC